MIPPKLPVDNLYKFLALGGAALYALFVSLAMNDAMTMFDSSLELEVRDAVLKAEVEYLKSRESVDSENVGETRYQLAIKKAELQANAKAFMKKTEIRQELFEVRKRIAHLALAVSFAGFILWYFRLQRYEDRKVRRESFRNGDESDDTV